MTKFKKGELYFWDYCEDGGEVRRLVVRAKSSEKGERVPEYSHKWWLIDDFTVCQEFKPLVPPNHAKENLDYWLQLIDAR